jgi:hypothetical protein
MNNFIEITLKVNENIIKETLERIGIANKKEKILYPSCYYYRIKEKDYILHFKQFFLLMRSNGYNNISEEDYERRNSVIFCLKNWGLIDVDDDLLEPHNKFVYVLPYHEKEDWQINHKFNMQNI